ncbi:MAG: L-seryl-tRNA(Sec) selenium transferase [Actinobacteria bacterium]|nr:L-seryl-tRNA(Sec) selenium transferase [Actinomycetota bacterium]
MPQDNQELLRQLPKVDELFLSRELTSVFADVPEKVGKDIVRSSIDEVRHRILEGSAQAVDLADIIADIRVKVMLSKRSSLRHVINASGIIIHTNLGRSPLADAALHAVLEVAGGYSTLEYDSDRRVRGSRHAHVETLICQLTGAEAAIAVNNNAAAVMLVLSEFACEKEVIVSRGELVEIGGSFRVPDIMALSRARMIEVGTTNKTHLYDYERAISPETALLLKVHPSNFKMIGFTESVSLSELKELSTKCGVPLYEDQGSGVLFDLACFKDCAEPTVASSLKLGCDLVSFSGDKLLGGPQAGIVAGSKQYIDRLKKHPLARALRLDKMTLAALEATLRICLDEQRALNEIPTLRMLTTPKKDLLQTAERLKDLLEKSVSTNDARFAIVDEISRAGGGSMPLCDIETYAVSIDFRQGSAEKLNAYLVSQRDTPIVTRTHDERILMDVRTILNDDELVEISNAITAFFMQR